MRDEGTPGLAVHARWHRPRESAPFLDVDVTLPTGITALVGPSGAGKSTLLAMIAGLVTPHAGRIAWHDGEVLDDVATRVHVPPHKRDVALVLQSLALFPHLSVLANVAYGIRDARARDQLAHRWLERMSVAHVAQQGVTSLSGGEAQRVALARACASSPRVLLLDEPFSALDRELRDALMGEVQAIVRELRVPCVVVTHEREDARRLAEHAIVLHAGRVSAQGPTHEVLPARTSHPV